MKKTLFLLCSLSTSVLIAQTSVDTISTSFGEFTLETTESLVTTTAINEETTATSDGGTVEFVTISSGARYASPQIVDGELQVDLAPNPASGIVELRISGISGLTSVVVSNVLGQIVYSSNLSVDQFRTVYLPAQQWPTGTYLVQVNHYSGFRAERLVVE